MVKLLDRELLHRLSRLPPLLTSLRPQLGDTSESISRESGFCWFPGIPTQSCHELAHRKQGRSRGPILRQGRRSSREIKHVAAVSDLNHAQSLQSRWLAPEELTLKMSVLSKAIYRFKAISPKFQYQFFFKQK